MIPSSDTRLASMIDAMTGVIMPALESSNAFAQEQAALVLGHLQVLRAQQPMADEFERLDYTRSRALADELLAHAAGGAAVTEAAGALRRIFVEPSPASLDQLRRAQDRIAAGIADLITAGGVDGTGEFVNASTAAVIENERAHALRMRSFFSIMGYEDGSTPVPAPADMMIEFRATYATDPGAAAKSPAGG